MKYRIRYMPDTVEDREKTKPIFPNTTRVLQKGSSLFKKKTSRLEDFPYFYPVYEDDTDYRMLEVGDYLVLYIVD